MIKKICTQVYCVFVSMGTKEDCVCWHRIKNNCIKINTIFHCFLSRQVCIVDISFARCFSLGRETDSNDTN